MLLCTIGATAENYNAQQEALRKEITSYLQRKGYKTEIQDDGLKFKNEGTTYYVEISDKDTNPMYLRLCMYVNFGTKLTREKALKDLNDYNVKFGVKVCCLKENLLISAEMFVNKSSEFTYAFDELLSQVKSTYDLVEEQNK